MAYQSFEDLEVWQRGCRLTVKLELLPKPTFDGLVKESKELSAMLEGLRRSMLSRVSKSKCST
jgi:hypothetical protein